MAPPGVFTFLLLPISNEWFDMCRSNLKRSKTKLLRDLGAWCLAAKVPVPPNSEVTRVAVYSARYIKHLHYTRSVEKDPPFFKSPRSIPVVGA